MELVSQKPNRAAHHEPRETIPRMFLVAATSNTSTIAASAPMSAPRIPLRKAGLSTRPANFHARANQ